MLGSSTRERGACRCRLGTVLRALGAVVAVAGLGVQSSLAAEAEMRSIASTPAQVAQGEALFPVCAGCHGLEGEGRQGIGPRLNSDSFLAAASDEFLVRTIAKGRAGTTMIPWGATLKESDIHSLVAFIRSWNSVPPAQLDESPLQGDSARGEQIFASICAGCHGRAGAGYQETANGSGIGRKAFLDEVSDGYLRYIVRSGKTQTMMRPFAKSSKVAVANLTRQQIDDVIAFLRSQAW